MACGIVQEWDPEKFRTHEEIEMIAERADLIEFDRGMYRHWAMYAGDGKVYNICAEGKDKEWAPIKLQTLKSVCELASEPCHQLVRINNQEKEALAHDALPANTPNEAIAAAEKVEGTVVEYSFLGKNCEYYCTLWKYGGRKMVMKDGWSTQVEKLGTGVLEPKLPLEPEYRCTREPILNLSRPFMEPAVLPIVRSMPTTIERVLTTTSSQPSRQPTVTSLLNLNPFNKGWF